MNHLIALFDYKRHYHRGTSGLKTVPMRVLSAIEESGEIPTLELGKRSEVPPATLIGILDDLERRGLVRRLRSTGDKRVVLVSATASGRELVALREEEERRFSEKVDGGLSPAERGALAALLSKLLGGIGDEAGLFKE